MDEVLLRRWIDALLHVKTGLERLNNSTESDFLAVGHHLDGLSGQAREIAGMATHAAAGISSREVEKDTESLRRILQRMDQHIAHSEGGMKRSLGMLRTIFVGLGNMERPFAGFKAIVKRLKVLGVSTKIESARLTTGDNGFNTLAIDVEKLADIIASKSSQILERLESLQAVIDRMLKRLVVQEEHEQGKAKASIDAIISGLSSLAGTRDSSSAAMRHVEELSTGITRDVSEIVASLQYHDITRQQIEHVIQAVEEWHGKLTEGSREGGLPEDLPLVADVCDLESRQLANSKKELTRAVRETTHHLDRIAGRTGEIAQEMGRLMHLTDGSSATLFSDLRTRVSGIMESLSEDEQAAESLSSGIRSVASTIKTLTDFVDEIEDIGTEIELIALNARIKAAHTGIEGAALGVLAEEIKNLSKDGRNQTVLITDSLHGMGSMAADLDAGTSEMKETTVREIGDMVREMQQLLGSFDRTNKQVVELLAGVEQGSGALGEAVKNVTARVTVEGRADRELDSAIGLLDGVVRQVRAEFPGARTASQVQYLKDLEKRYTMHRERDIHKGSDDIGSDIGLGENVELF